MKILANFTSLILISFILTGCGGGGGSTPPTASLTGAGSAVLTWIKPTQNTNDSELTDLEIFKVYFGSQADYVEDSDGFVPFSIAVDNQDGDTDNSNMNCQNLENGEKMECTLAGLDDETNWYFGVTAVNSQGIESDRSSILCKSFSGDCSTWLEAIESQI